MTNIQLLVYTHHRSFPHSYIIITIEIPCDYRILLLLFRRSRDTRRSRRDPREYDDIFVTYIRRAMCARVVLRGYVHVYVLKPPPPPRLCGTIQAFSSPVSIAALTLLVNM